MTKTPQDFGAKGDGVSNDAVALNAWLAQGGTLELTGGPYLFDGPLGYVSGSRLTIKSRLLMRQGWDSGYALCSNLLRHGNKTARTNDVVIDMTGGGIEFVQHGSTKPRKGLGITYTDGATIVSPKVQSTFAEGSHDYKINLFAMEIRNSTDGTVKGGFLNVISGQEGCDGLHFIGNCADWTIDGMQIISGDDCFGLTHERSVGTVGTIERITIQNCSAENKAHSAIKILSEVSGCVIRDITFKNNDLMTTLNVSGQGAPIKIIADKGTIDGVKVTGGNVRVIIPSGGKVNGLLAEVGGAARNVNLSPDTIEHWDRGLLEAQTAPPLIFAPGRVTALKPVSKPSPQYDRPLVRVKSGSTVALPPGTATYPGQTLIEYV